MKTGRKITHGHHTRSSRRSGEYISWDKMIQRCTNEKNASFKHYGAKGIKVCDRWRESFSNFLSDMGEKPTRLHSLDRFPNKHGNYEPGNCRWATPLEQQNNRTDNVLITINGETGTVAEWSRKLGVNPCILYDRLNNGVIAR